MALGALLIVDCSHCLILFSLAILFSARWIPDAQSNDPDDIPTPVLSTTPL